MDGSIYPFFNDADETKAMRDRLKSWFEERLGADVPLFSFCLDGKQSYIYIGNWQKNVEMCESDAGSKYTVTYRSPDGLVFRLDATAFYDSPTVDWIIHVKNEGTTRSAVISELRVMQDVFPLPGDGLMLHTSNGTELLADNDVADFSLLEFDLSKKVSYSFSPTGAKSSDRAWPYFDVAQKDRGIIFAVGWTGSWQTTVKGTHEGPEIGIGFKTFLSFLFPGEEIRTPRVSLTYYEGDAGYGHNLFRRLMLKHYTPDDGTQDRCKFPVSVTTCSMSEDNIISDLSKWFGKLGVEGIWTDAGWYGETPVNEHGNASGETWGINLGNWYVSPQLYPSGSMRRVSDFIHKNGKKLILWFEPERSWHNGRVHLEHPEWFYSHRFNNDSEFILDLGNEKAFGWLLDFLKSFLTDNGVDIYRQDFNYHELHLAFAEADEENRIGIHEIHHYTNLYRLFDALRESIPGLMIDNCCSGGKRMDIEMMKRSYVLHRTDYTCLPYGEHWNMEGCQYQTQSLSYWLPLYGTSVGWDVRLFEDPYLTRSLMAAGASLGVPIGYAADDLLAKRLIDELCECRKYFYGDFYSIDGPVYDRCSRQCSFYYRRDLGQGLLIVYDRPERSGSLPYRIKLKGLPEGKKYAVHASEPGKVHEEVFTSEVLTDDGLEINTEPGQALLIFIDEITSDDCH